MVRLLGAWCKPDLKLMNQIEWTEYETRKSELVNLCRRLCVCQILAGGLHSLDRIPQLPTTAYIHTLHHSPTP